MLRQAQHEEYRTAPTTENLILSLSKDEAVEAGAVSAAPHLKPKNLVNTSTGSRSLTSVFSGLELSA